jgi:two-component system sensor kinase FixL
VLAAIVESAVDAIIVIDAQGRIETFNPAAERLFGYREADVVGHNVSMLMPSPYREEHDGYLARYLETGNASIIGIGREVRALTRDGSIVPVHLSVGEMTVDGERKFTGIIHDLSDRVALEVRLRSSEERWRSIIESAVDGIIVIDAEGRIEAFNPAAERLFGYEESEVTGRNVNLLMPSPYREEHDQYLARYLSTGQAQIIGIGREVTARRRDGTTFPVHLSVGEMTVGGARKFTGIIHDLSARVRMEEQLREQAALVRLGEMAAVIAHEIKNPLAGIRGAVQVIGSRLAPASREAAVTGEIVTRIDALNGLIQDLLLFARPPRPRPIPVNVSSVIAMTVDLLRADPIIGGVEIDVNGSSPPVLVDPELLKIVFQNLLINSAQAMQGRGRIQIALRSENGRCEIRVADTGPGIPEDIRDRIFTPFFTTKARGTGLGLPTARRLIEAHHGTLVVGFPAGGGTMVAVQLPLAEAVAGASV